MSEQVTPPKPNAACIDAEMQRLVKAASASSTYECRLEQVAELLTELSTVLHVAVMQYGVFYQRIKDDLPIASTFANDLLPQVANLKAAVTEEAAKAAQVTHSIGAELAVLRAKAMGR